MSLKIDGIGKPISSFTYTVNLTANQTVLLTINPTGYVSRSYELFRDNRHPDVNAICAQVSNALKAAQGYSLVKIKCDKERRYVHFRLPGNVSEQYSGTKI